MTAAPFVAGPPPGPAPAVGTPPPAAAGGDIAGGSPLLVFRLGAGGYAVPAAAVAAVLRTPVVTSLPGAPAWLAGVAAWRGRVLAVLRLEPLLGGPVPVAYGDHTVVLESDGMAVGVVVDAVVRVGADAVAGGPVAALPDTAGPGARRILAGRLAGTDGPLALVDPVAVLSLRADLVEPA